MMLSEHINTKTDKALCPCCGCGAMEINKSGIMVLFEEFRKELNIYYGKSVGLHIESGFRCYDRHVQIYKNLYGDDWKKYIAKNSRHLSGEAFDLHPIGITPEQLHFFALNVFMENYILKGGLGLYKWGTHIDSSNHRFWDNR